MSDQWLNKPDGDGLWFMSEPGGVHLIHVHGGGYRYLQVQGVPSAGDYVYPTKSMSHKERKFLRVIVALPAPYVAPKPPKVEQYAALTKPNKEPRFISRVADWYVATDSNGDFVHSSAWSDRDRYYTDINPVEGNP